MVAAIGRNSRSNFVRVDVLRFVYFQQRVRRVAHDMGARLCGEKPLSGPSQPNAIAALDGGEPRSSVESGRAQPLPEPPQADAALWLERGGALDRIDGAPVVGEQDRQFDLRRKLVLASLAGDQDREAAAFAREHAADDRAGDLPLVGTQRRNRGWRGSRR